MEFTPTADATLLLMQMFDKTRPFIFHVFAKTLPFDRLAQILGYVFISWTLSILQSFIVIG